MVIRDLADDLMTLRECGDLLGRAPITMRKYVQLEGLPVVRKGGRNLVFKSDFDEWRARPEIAGMLAMGDRILRGVQGDLRRVRQSAQTD